MNQKALFATIVFLIAGCGESHVGGDAAPDTASDTSTGVDTSGSIDACTLPPPELCYRGACCDRVAETIVVGCEQVCPEGFARSCEPEVGCDGDGEPRFCADATECTLINDDVCCGCGDEIVIHRDAVPDFLSGRGMCEELPCPPCEAPGFNPRVPTCDDTNRCVPFDITRSEYAVCETDADCRVRTKECCECGGSTDLPFLVAVSRRGPSFEELVCPEGLGCLDCAPAYPDEVRARCDEGFCALAYR